MNIDAENEKALLRKAVRGDRRACEELVRRNQDLIYNSIIYMTGDPDAAEDLTQSVFMKALENIDSFKGKSKFSTWLYSIMLNTVRNFQRKMVRYRTVSLDDNPGESSWTLKDDLRAGGKEPWEALVSQENTQLIKTALASLKDEYREIIVLRDIEGLSYIRLAKVLDISQGTVKSRLSRARCALKLQLERVMEEI